MEATMDKLQQRGKIVRGTEGLGTVTPQMIEERAREIACSDGRARPNDLDRPARARGIDRCYIILGEASDEGGTGARLANATCLDGGEGSDSSS